MDSITGSVDSIVFQNNSSNFTVIRVSPVEGSTNITVIGNFPSILVGEQIEMAGEWVVHSRFGRQFKAQSFRRVAPLSVKGIERFLASGVIKGIGRSIAARIVAKFGLRTLEVLEHYPHRLTDVEGIGTKKAETIRLSFAEHSEMRELMLFLETHGVTGAFAGKLIARYGPSALSLIQENPYRLAEDISGIGFRTADQIAMALGWEYSRPERLAAGIEHALTQIAQAGHCCVPENALVKDAAKILNAPTAEVALTLADLIKKEVLCTEDYQGSELIYPTYLYHAECNVAERLRRLQSRATPTKCLDSDETVENWEKTAGISLAKAQSQALAAALEHGVLVLTGGPGTGKTVTVKGILAVLAQQGFKILLGAPTGRAAKRLSEACEREAFTIHRLLEASGGTEGGMTFGRNEENQLEADVVIIDEASMIDITLMHCFLRAVPEGCRVIFVGDIDQLPAVGPGSVLKDIIRSATVPTVRLTEVFRQAGESIIVTNAHKINRGLLPDYQYSPDFQFRELNDERQVAEAIVELCYKELPESGFDAWRDVQVLSPMHRDACGVENLNKLLQAALNPLVAEGQAVVSGNRTLRQGDKVMQVRNNYIKGVFNGDIGLVIGADTSNIIVRYPENDVVYEHNEMDEITLAYAMSVHKSQGSEYPVVVVPLVASHHIMLQRNLLYTAVTRAKRRVVLLGSKAALNTAVANDRTRRRYTLLAERLRGGGLC
jgi:exodeoxyribonuclease V alpha subunit